MLIDDQLSLARAGDGDAFRRLTEPHRRELQVHCYRMLGSLQDAEDALQDTLLAAWQGLDAFEGRSSLRTWLYRIATTRCLNVLRASSRRPTKEWNMFDLDLDLPEPSRLGEVTWLEPYPDSLFRGTGAVPGPETRYEQTESISLAFVTALQILPARQRAVLILREVLGYHATEVADMLDSSVDSVNSALKRARAALRQRLPAEDGGQPAPRAESAAERDLVARFVLAYQSGDVDALIALLTADVTVAMPPVPLEYQGRDAVALFYESVMRAGRHYDLVPTRANGQLAFGAYLRPTAGGIRRGAGLLVLTVAGAQISAITRFDNNVLPWFGLPSSLPQ